jgi:hypothetical protein
VNTSKPYDTCYSVECPIRTLLVGRTLRLCQNLQPKAPGVRDAILCTARGGAVTDEHKTTKGA